VPGGNENSAASSFCLSKDSFGGTWNYESNNLSMFKCRKSLLTLYSAVLRTPWTKGAFTWASSGSSECKLGDIFTSKSQGTRSESKITSKPNSSKQLYFDSTFALIMLLMPFSPARIVRRTKLLRASHRQSVRTPRFAKYVHRDLMVHLCPWQALTSSFFE